MKQTAWKLSNNFVNNKVAKIFPKVVKWALYEIWFDLKTYFMISNLIIFITFISILTVMSGKAKIKDLCPEDKKKIGNLIKKLADERE